MKSSARPKAITLTTLHAIMLVAICYLTKADLKAQNATYNDVTVTGTLTVDEIETASGESLETTFGQDNTVTGLHAFAFGQGSRATGDYSAAWGGNPTAPHGAGGNYAGGDASTAWGWAENSASNKASTAWGSWGNSASGPASTVWGDFANSAIGRASTAWGMSFNMAVGYASTAFGGSYNEARGNASTVWGEYYNVAYGTGSTAWGWESAADAYLSTAFGRANRGGYSFTDDGDDYNDGNTEWFDLDPLFEVGNGTDDQNRSNAISTLKNGKTTLENKFWDENNPNTIPADSNGSDGVALDVKGHVSVAGRTMLLGRATITYIVPQGDIPMYEE